MIVTPRPAATVCLLRDRAGGLEVLMVKRSAAARFMAGVWVFPGGAVDGSDADAAVIASKAEDVAWRLAALRELVEEVGIWVTVDGDFSGREPAGSSILDAARARQTRFAGDRLGYFANWITPAPLPIRFDTRFYAVVVDVPAVIDAAELVDSTWVAPADALQRHAADEWTVAYPTERSLQFLARFATTADAMRGIEALRHVPARQPTIVVDDGKLGMVLPGDHGYAEAAAAELEEGFLDRVKHVLDRTGEIPPEQR